MPQIFKKSLLPIVFSVQNRPFLTEKKVYCRTYSTIIDCSSINKFLTIRPTFSKWNGFLYIVNKYSENIDYTTFSSSLSLTHSKYRSCFDDRKTEKRNREREVFCIFTKKGHFYWQREREKKTVLVCMTGTEWKSLNSYCQSKYIYWEQK